MNVTIKPSAACGTVKAPPSKSFAHRMLICAALSGNSSVSGISQSEDMLATLDCIKALGVKAETCGDAVALSGKPGNVPDGTVFPCRESGSTLRFFIPLSLVYGGNAVFSGAERLIERGIGVYENLFAEKGIEVKKDKSSIAIRGTLESGEFTIPGGISSQFVSGLLFALPLLSGDSVLRVLPPIESRPYIDITLAVMRSFGIEIAEKQSGEFYIKGSQTYKNMNACVEGDWSNAAALLAFGSIGGNVNVTGLDEKSIQGDRVCVDALKALEGGNAVIDLSDCPDLGPVLFAVAAAKNGALFTGTKRLRIKESDRASAMAAELAKFGIKAAVNDNSVAVEKGTLSAPEKVLCGHNDHRIVMALSLLCSLTGGTISDAEAVAKSYPDYFEDIKNLGVEVDCHS